MRLLVCLAERCGEVVSIDELLDQVWAGVIVTPDSVYQGITALRRHLGDDPKTPAYIATVPRLGYRMVATVSPWIDLPTVGPDSPPIPTTEAAPPAAERSTANSRPRYVALGLAMAIIIAAVTAYSVHSRLASRQVAGAFGASPAERSVGVLPFLDLTTQEMNEEYFADGLTEELIGDLSNGAGLRVPSPTSSFYFKGKQLPIRDIARQLGVYYLLDGSVRKSGNVYRVAVRLVRADNGYVVYTGTYDRPLGDLLAVQKSIAAEAAIAVRNAIEAAGTR